MKKKEIVPEEISVVNEGATPRIANQLNDFQKSALEEAEKQLESLRKEHSTKKYLIDLKKDDIVLLSEFISTDAPWKFTECLGIVEVAKELDTCVKSGKLLTSAVAVEAIYYYMSKVEGKGNTTNSNSFVKLNDYLRVLKAITTGLEKIKADSEILKNAEFVVAARREGIEPDSSLLQK